MSSIQPTSIPKPVLTSQQPVQESAVGVLSGELAEATSVLCTGKRLVIWGSIGTFALVLAY